MKKDPKSMEDLGYAEKISKHNLFANHFKTFFSSINVYFVYFQEYYFIF